MIFVYDQGLIVFYNCMKYHSNSFNGFQLTERTRNSIANDQREITPKICRVLAYDLSSQCALQLYAVTSK